MESPQTDTTSAEYFDLEDAVQNTTATLWLKHPASGRATPATIILAGPEHPARKADEWARTRALRQEVEATGKYLFKEPADIEQEELNHLSACTLGWSGLAARGAGGPDAV